jgi:hypothetical protein
MSVIGIITCEILELEFARLLSEDSDVKRVSVIENNCSEKLIELLAAEKVSGLQRLPHIHAFTPEPDLKLEALVSVLEIGLHRNRKVLGRAVINAIRSMQFKADAVLLGYGKCGGSLLDIHETVDTSVPLFQPMDGDHLVDDCVALCLGGGERYYKEQRNTAGTFFLTPGWGRHWKKMLDLPNGTLSQPGLKRLLSGYERGLIVQTPAIADKELQSHGEDFASVTGLRLEAKEGTMDPLIKAWNSAKDAIQSEYVFDAAGSSL